MTPSSSSADLAVSFPPCECPSFSSSSSEEQNDVSSRLSCSLSDTFSPEVLEEIEALQAIYGDEHVKISPCCRLIQIRTESMQCLSRDEENHLHPKEDQEEKRQEEGETVYKPIYFIVQLYIPVRYKQDTSSSERIDKEASETREDQAIPICLVHLPWRPSDPHEDQRMQDEILKLQQDSSTSLFDYVECIRNFLPLPSPSSYDREDGRRSGRRAIYHGAKGWSSSLHSLSSRDSSRDRRSKREEVEEDEREEEKTTLEEITKPYISRCSSIYDSDEDEEEFCLHKGKKKTHQRKIRCQKEDEKRDDSYSLQDKSSSSSSCLSCLSVSPFGLDLSIGPVVTVHKSRFIGICASVHTPQEVHEVYRHIKETYPGATHYIMAYSLRYQKKPHPSNSSSSSSSSFPSVKTKRKEKHLSSSKEDPRHFQGHSTSHAPSSSSMNEEHPIHRQNPGKHKPAWSSREKEEKKDEDNEEESPTHHSSSPTPTWIENCDHDSDGEGGAGKKLQQLLWNLKVSNVILIVIRYYGGIHLGPDRFRVIASVGREILEESGFLLSSSTSHSKTTQKISHHSSKK
ncbi:impact [Cystoisospora suis]|uniref:Impact n=1 Tax=Cystoisospora suis TaxID=483139 RepID=A0A2C6LAA2_9APIC|nr:impact [Cystoisospora suis]